MNKMIWFVSEISRTNLFHIKRSMCLGFHFLAFIMNELQWTSVICRQIQMIREQIIESSKVLEGSRKKIGLKMKLTENANYTD